MLLRRQVRALERQLARRVRFRQADRTSVAALGHMLPRRKAPLPRSCSQLALRVTIGHHPSSPLGLRRLCCTVGSGGAGTPNRVTLQSARGGEFVERCRGPEMTVSGFDAECVVASVQVLHERLTANDHLRCPISHRSSHRPHARFEPTAVAPDTIVRILLRVVEPKRHQLVDHMLHGRSRVGNYSVWLAVGTHKGMRNLRATVISRRADTHTPMTWPCSSTAR